jgi:1-deoxy-D-xylulose-5-phosphate reductoisomerase
VDVVVHRQSVIHSMVEYVDGSVLAQLASPDMRVPIAHALAWPQRRESGAQRLDLLTVGRLDFEPPDLERFPCLAYAYAAAREGGTMPAIMNAANEVAVAAFLENRIRFTDIPWVIERTMAAVPAEQITDLDSVIEADRHARSHAAQILRASAGSAVL